MTKTLIAYSIIAIDAAVVRTQIDGEVLQAERDNSPFQVNHSFSYNSRMRNCFAHWDSLKVNTVGI